MFWWGKCYSDIFVDLLLYRKFKTVNRQCPSNGNLQERTAKRSQLLVWSWRCLIGGKNEEMNKGFEESNIVSIGHSQDWSKIKYMEHTK